MHQLMARASPHCRTHCRVLPASNPRPTSMGTTQHLSQAWPHMHMRSLAKGHALQLQHDSLWQLSTGLVLPGPAKHPLQHGTASACFRPSLALGGAKCTTVLGRLMASRMTSSMGMVPLALQALQHTVRCSL